VGEKTKNMHSKTTYRKGEKFSICNRNAELSYSTRNRVTGWGGSRLNVAKQGYRKFLGGQEGKYLLNREVKAKKTFKKMGGTTEKGGNRSKRVQ